jgi:FkbM family methyltransferase
MSYAARPPRFFDSPLYRRLVDGAPFWVVDGGARGELFDPFDQVAQGIAVIAFEPDSEARPSVGRDGRQTVWVSKALWKESATIDIHLAASRATSSVYPPDMERLRLFPPKHGLTSRRTEQEVRVPAISIDDAVGQGLCPAPRFIKLDIHSAEYEALEGAAQTLSGVVGVLVETWHLPLHRGQRLHGDVECLLNRHGLHLFHQRPAAAWKHALDGRRNRFDKTQLVASECLFLPEPAALAAADPTRGVFAVAVADLFGYAHYAVQLSRELAACGVLAPAVQAEIEHELTRLNARRKLDIISPPSIGRWMHGVKRALLGKA